jgi:hypothetical protein
MRCRCGAKELMPNRVVLGLLDGLSVRPKHGLARASGPFSTVPSGIGELDREESLTFSPSSTGNN